MCKALFGLAVAILIAWAGVGIVDNGRAYGEDPYYRKGPKIILPNPDLWKPKPTPKPEVVEEEDPEDNLLLDVVYCSEEDKVDGECPETDKEKEPDEENLLLDVEYE